MLRIRLQRLGKIKQAVYRVIVSEKNRDTHYTSTEILGIYDPNSKKFEMKKDRIQYWMSVGAQPSSTLHNMLVREGIITGKKQKSVAISEKRKVKIASKKAEAEKSATAKASA